MFAVKSSFVKYKCHVANAVSAKMNLIAFYSTATLELVRLFPKK